MTLHMNTVSPVLLDEAVRRIVQAVHPEQILLFGSQAWGQPTADSDIDLLVILGASDQPGYRQHVRSTAACGDCGYRSRCWCVRAQRSREQPSARPHWNGKRWITGVSSMDEGKARTVGHWLRKARHDPRSAYRLYTDAPPLLDTAAYHCQQAAEKALKG